ncbi:metallophosphoesterase [Paenibacillus sp. SYP-B4298]|uniref:metallophosphoesterase n=1 Tax=Paenibacillus sp. SYP-B4298 TaxID=2996034 RepID=UPI0022DD49ED|nr:metallophosphoesterase [Paenibacillus sp. SYP-B4298]
MAWLWLVLPVIAAVGWMAREARSNRIVQEEVTLDNLPAAFDGLRVFFISDIHRREVPEALIADCMQSGGADLVLIGGDIREKGVPLERTRVSLRRLRKLGPVYAVYGNHDYDEPISRLDELLRSEQVLPLRNDYAELRDGDERLRICGVDDPITGHDQLRKALGSYDADSGLRPCVILLSHAPNLIGHLGDAKIDLMLSGHTHGGQIVLPLVGPLVRNKVVNTYRSGWFVVGNQGRTTKLLVSCGYGTSRLPLRLLAPAQTHLLVLRSTAAKNRRIAFPARREQ